MGGDNGLHMTIATKNGSIIVKNGRVAENCGCCGEPSCANRISAVRMRISSAAQYQNSEVAGGRPAQATAVSFPNTPEGELSAKQAKLAFFNQDRPGDFPFARWATYSQSVAPSGNPVTLQGVSSPAEACNCNYSAYRQASVGSFTASEIWSASFQLCAVEQQIRLVSFSLPLANLSFFTQPDIGIDKLQAQYALGYGWFVFLNGAMFDSGGYCDAGNQFFVFDSSTGGVQTSAGSLTDSRTVNIDRPIAPGATVTFQHTQSVSRYRQVWNNSPDPRYNTASRCSLTQQMTSQYTVAVEVDVS